MGTRVAQRHFGIVLCGILPALAVGPTRGAEWSFEPSAGLRGDYNTNVGLTPNPHSPAWGMKVTANVPFRGASEALTVTGGLSVGFDRYFGQPQYNSDNYDLNLSSSYKAERDTYGLSLDAVRSSTLANELTTTGVVLAYRPQNTLVVTPSWSRAITERTSINAGYSLNYANYHDTSGTSLTGNLDQTAFVGWQSDVNEGRVFNLQAYYDRYESRPSQVVQNTYGVRGGYDHAWSETLHSTFLIGWRWTQSTISAQALICDGPIIVGVCSGTIVETTSVQRQDSSGLTLSAVLEKRSETDTIRADVSQQVYPSGAGSLVQTQRAGVSWTKQWSPTLSSSIDAAAYRTEYIGGVVTSSNNRYYSFNAVLTRQLSDAWRLAAGYTYARQKYDTIPVAANDNVVYVALSYSWRVLSFSR